MKVELRRSYCALCISRCGCVGRVEDGVLTRVDPDPDHPTGQALCVKARTAPESVYAPERILRPLRRTRPKGEADAGWEPISWDAAPRPWAWRMPSWRRAATTTISSAAGAIRRFSSPRPAGRC